MSDLEKISSELVSIAYQDKGERVNSLEKLEMQIPTLTSSFPEEQKKLIKQIISELKEEASIDTISSSEQMIELTPTIVQEKDIEVIEPITLEQPEIINIQSEKSKTEKDLSFLDDIDNAF
jgi:hypothetical protein